SLHTLKLRSTDLSDSSLGRLLALCTLSLQHLDISYTQIKSLDILSRALHSSPSWRLEKLVASGLPLSPATLVGFFKPLSERGSEERGRLKVVKLGAIPSTSSKQPGLTDKVLEKVLPFLERLEGLEKVSFFQNWEFLDLTLYVQPHHLEGLLPSLDNPLPPPSLEVLILDSSKITDESATAIGECKELRSLHCAETKISSELCGVFECGHGKLSEIGNVEFDEL
ncbi:hypothetical protein P7C70_g5563, partial [Phenoliferia sp. Uapishka_3]